MKERRLLYAIGWVKDEYIEEMQQSNSQRASKKRIWLIAAAISVALLLVGCAVVYFWLQDMSIGTDTYTKTHDDQGQALEEPVEIERQVLTFVGCSDSPTNQAAREWYAFCESYELNYELMANNPDMPGIENNYKNVYGCYTPEMVAKLNEIVEKYNVKLLGEWVPVQWWQSNVALREGLGVETLLKKDAPAEMGDVSGMLYPPYNYDLEFKLTLTGEDAAWTKAVSADAYYYHTNYLPSNVHWILDAERFEQWNYTTTDGVKLLLAMNTKGNGFIICQREEAFQVVAIMGNQTGSAYPNADQLPGKKALEQMAEVFDFSFTPRQIDKAAMQPAMDAADAEYQAAHAYVPEVYAGYEDYLRERCVAFYDTVQYINYDLNGDGEKELLLGDTTKVKSFFWCLLSMRDGQVVVTLADKYLYEGNVDMSYHDAPHSSYGRWMFWKRAFTGEENNDQFLGYVVHNADGSWQLSTEYSITYDEAPTVTQTEAEAFLAQFIPMELDYWRSINDYPLSDGSTIGDYKASLDKPLSKEELRRFYAETFAEEGDKFRTHYRLMDINGDGVEEILISGNGETFWEIFSYSYGQARSMGTFDVTLCENGVLESVSLYQVEPGIEIVEYEFFILDGYKRVMLDYVAYNKSTASWQTDLDGTTIPEADAQAILAKYTRIDQDMKPISELMTE